MEKIKKFKRVFVIVTDSMGIGECPDSYKYDDLGANTFGHIANLYPDFKVDKLKKWMFILLWQMWATQFLKLVKHT